MGNDDHCAYTPSTSNHRPVDAKEKKMSTSILKTLIKEKGAEHLFKANRLATYKNKWDYDKKADAVCTSEKMAEAGFICTVTKKDRDSAKCFFCRHEMLWDPEDDPKVEHANHSPQCAFVRLNKPEEEWTVKEALQMLGFVAYLMKHEAQDEEFVSDVQRTYKKLAIDGEKVLDIL
jgi:hypothetical protein